MNNNDLMKIQTRDFGEVEISNQDIFTFEQPIFGFEDYKKFVFLYDDQLNEYFVWLQSVENPDVCFILVDPTKIIEDYNVNLSNEVFDTLGDGELALWFVTVMEEDLMESTANLRAPFIFNVENKKAMQVVLEEDYNIKHYIFKSEEE